MNLRATQAIYRFEMARTFRTILQSRMQVGLAKYAQQYPDTDQVADSLDFHLVRALLKSYQGDAREQVVNFDAALRESHEKYRALVEVTTEGIVMVLDGRCAYLNHAMLEMLAGRFHLEAPGARAAPADAAAGVATCAELRLARLL